MSDSFLESEILADRVRDEACRALQAGRDIRQRERDAFRAESQLVWAGLLDCFEHEEPFRLRDAMRASEALQKVGSLLCRIPDAWEPAAVVPASSRLGRFKAARFQERAPVTAAAILLEGVKGTAPTQLADLLRRVDRSEKLRTAFGWLTFFRDQFVSPPKIQHASGFSMHTEAEPPAFYVPDFELAKRLLCETSDPIEVRLPPVETMHPAEGVSKRMPFDADEDGAEDYPAVQRDGIVFLSPTRIQHGTQAKDGQQLPVQFLRAFLEIRGGRDLPVSAGRVLRTAGSTAENPNAAVRDANKLLEGVGYPNRIKRSRDKMGKHVYVSLVPAKSPRK